jgi:uncharacterized protein
VSASAPGYHLIQRLGRWGPGDWWRPLLGIVAFVALFLVAQTALVVVFTIGYTITGSSDPAHELSDSLTDVTPAGLAYTNLTLASAIPIALLVAWFLHRLAPGWLASVVGRMRWRWLGHCVWLAFLTLIATLAVSALLPSQGDGTTISGELNPWTSTLRDFVLVVLFLTPLQAAGEEYAFRGYLTQAFGGLFAGLGPRTARAAAVLLPALLFALAHGAQDAPIFVDRFAFGLVAGTLVILTGGLEAGIAMHVLNNFLAFGLALAYADMSSALNPTGGTWWSLPVTLTQSLVYLGLCLWSARRQGIATVVTPAPGASELEGQKGLV